MVEDVKNVANAFVDDVLNGVSNEMSKKGGGDDKSRQRSLLCVMFTPSMSHGEGFCGQEKRSIATILSRSTGSGPTIDILAVT
jgi:hypothetical protein